MDYTRLATVTIYTNNLTPMPKISCWFVFILICGRREHSKKKKAFRAFTYSNESWNNITYSTNNKHQP